MTERFDWERPTSPPQLGWGEVHVWRVSLPLSTEGYDVLWGLLAAEEQEKAQRFHFAQDRQRSVAARGTLRLLLEHYRKGIGEVGQPLRFRYNPYGKPSLLNSRLQFNVAHSGDRVVLAFTLLGPLGIDVEYMRSQIDLVDLAKHFFAPRESAKLLELPQDSRLSAFYSCWTRKEAYIKAWGMGLSLPLDSFVVSFVSGEPTALLEVHEGACSDWALFPLEPGDNYAGALAVRSEGAFCTVRCFDWQEEYLFCR